MRNSSHSVYMQRLALVEDFIAKNLDREFDLEELARLACFSPFHFHRIFAAVKGVSIGDYVRRLRLERAAHMLLTSRRSVADIAEAAQYANHESFTRAFGRRYGMSPAAWRRAGVDSSQQAGGLGAAWLEADAGAAEPTPPPSFEPQSQGPEPQANPEFPSAVLRRPAETVYAQRHVGSYWTVGQTWQALFKKLRGCGIDPDDCRWYGMPYDDPAVTDAQTCRYDACVALPTERAAAGTAGDWPDCGLERIDVPAAEFLRVEFRGLIQQIPRAYVFMFGQLLPSIGRVPADFPVIEDYLQGAENPLGPMTVHLLLALETIKRKPDSAHSNSEQNTEDKYESG